MRIRLAIYPLIALIALVGCATGGNGAPAAAVSSVPIPSDFRLGTYTGGWEASGGNGGALAFLFERGRDGRAEGALVNSTGTVGITDRKEGPLAHLKIGAKKVSFSTQIGADYDLVRQPSGCLTGTATLRTNPPVRVKVCPQ